MAAISVSVSMPGTTPRRDVRTLRTHGLFFEADAEGRDFSSVLKGVQAYLSGVIQHHAGDMQHAPHHVDGMLRAVKMLRQLL